MFFLKDFWFLSGGTWKINEKLLVGLSKSHSMGPRENFHSKIFEASFYTFQIFRIKNEVSVTTTKIFFQAWQNCKQSLEEQSKKKLVSKE